MTELPDAPQWASTMSASMDRGFRDVHRRLDDLDEKVDPLVEFRIRHDEREAASRSRRNKLFAVAGAVGTLIGGVVTTVLGSNPK